MRWALAFAFLFSPALSSGAAQDPFSYASAATGIPVQILLAISRVESDHHPWALNLDGKGAYPSSREEAENILRSAPENTDIGLMQVNFRIWGAALGVTKEQLLDPYLNVWFGSMILRHHLSRYPFWEAVGRYHSGDRNRQIGYAWRVYQALLNNQRLNAVPGAVPSLSRKRECFLMSNTLTMTWELRRRHNQRCQQERS